MNLHPFQTALLEQRGEGLTDLLAPTAQLHSPVLHLPFVGRDTVAAMLPVLRGNFSKVVYTDSFEAPATRAVVFRANIAGLAAEGFQLLRLDGEGLVEHVTVMLRPMSATRALAEAMSTKVERLPDDTYRLRAAARA